MTLRGPCDDPPLTPRERALSGLPCDPRCECDQCTVVEPHPAEAYLADVGHAELAAAELTDLRVELARTRAEATEQRARAERIFKLMKREEAEAERLAGALTREEHRTEEVTAVLRALRTYLLVHRMWRASWDSLIGWHEAGG